MELGNINREALKSLRKISLKRIVRRTILATSLSTYLLFSQNPSTIPIPSNASKEVAEFIDEKNKIEAINSKENYTFINDDLKKIIYSNLNKDLKENITFKELRKVKELEINNQLDINSLADLKYLTNLRSITFDNCLVDCSFLEYNQNLEEVVIGYSEIINNSKLPNTIKRLTLINSSCSEESFQVPFATVQLSIIYSYVNNIIFKNPQKLHAFNYNSPSFFDLRVLKECQKLKYIDLSSSPNIKNSDVLLECSNIEQITLDDYAPIWLDYKTLSKIPPTKLVVPYDLSKECKTLDEIATDILKNNKTIEDRTDATIKYILNIFTYNDYLINSSMKEEDLLKEYNSYPIKTSLTKDSVICINYATLYQAIMNRLNIESYVIQNNTHAWNAYNIEGGLKEIDLTNLDQTPLIYDKATKKTYLINDKDTIDILNSSDKERLYYYDLSENQISDFTYEALNYPIILKKNSIKDIGYVSNTNIVYEILYKNRKYLLTPIALILLIQIISELKKYKVLDEKLKEYHEKDIEIAQEIIKKIKNM